MFLKHFGIHILNVFGALVVILIAAYYLGFLDTEIGAFSGFKGDWVCGKHELDLHIDEKLKVFIKPELKQTSVHLQMYSEVSAHFVDEGHSVLFEKLPLDFRGLGQVAFIAAPDGKYSIYSCRRPRIFEDYFYSR